MMGAIKILAGDFQIGKSCEYSSGKLHFDLSWFKREVVELTEIELVEVVDSEAAAKRILGAVGWGFATSILLGPVLGPVGLAALVFRAANKRVVFACKLKDGRKVLGEARKDVVQKLSLAALKSSFNAEEPRPQISD